MEKRLEEDIKVFLTISYGDGYGDGSGDGSGDGDGSGYGYGYGSGDGYGDGYGDGSGDGSGDGYGDGSGIPEFNGMKVYQIDGVATLIDSVHGNYAKGSILCSDFTLKPCYIARVDNSFAHGETLRKAMQDAASKAMERMPLEDRISEFKKLFPYADTMIPARKLYDWHHILTGSCEMGRKQFARDNNIDIDSDYFTIREFISLTKHSYGSEAIRQLAEAYGISINN